MFTSSIRPAQRFKKAPACLWAPQRVARKLRIEPLEDRSMLAVSVVPTAETAAASSADDIAIWIHPTDPSKSTVIGTAKSSSSSLRVYDLAGRQLQSVNVANVNNVDLRYNFPLAGQATTILVGSDRANGGIVIFKVDGQSGLLSNIAARTISTGMDIYGAAMYVSPSTGKYYAFVTSESGQVQQWELFATAAGNVDAKQVRSFSIGSKSEGLVADDIHSQLFVGQEDVGIWKYSAEPDGGTGRTRVDSTSSGGALAADVEGLSIYYKSNGTGYLLASSQGNSEFSVYRREGANQYLGNFKLIAGGAIDAVTDTDGIDVTNFALNHQFPQGMFVAQDNDENFKFVRWDSINQAFAELLSIDTTWDPRLVGGGPLSNRAPQVNAGVDQTIQVGTTAFLDATVTDDGLPNPPSRVITSWLYVSGPGDVSFADAAAADTTATFSAVGSYLLRLTAQDGEFTTRDDLMVNVTSVPSKADFQDGVSSGGNYAGTRDTTFRSDRTSATGGSAMELVVDGAPDRAALIFWDVSSIAPGTILRSADITLNITNSSTDTYELFALKRNWSEAQAKWKVASRGNAWSTAGAQGTADRDTTVLGTIQATSRGKLTVSLNASGLGVVQGWINNPASNFGLIIQDYVGSSDGLGFSSSEASTVTNRPKLTLGFATPESLSALSILPIAKSPTDRADIVFRDANFVSGLSPQLLDPLRGNHHSSDSAYRRRRPSWAEGDRDGDGDVDIDDLSYAVGNYRG